MPRVSHASANRLATNTLVIDNGAYSIKAGLLSATSAEVNSYNLVPNCIARGPDGPRSTKVYVGGELETCKDFAEMTFRRPVERGYVVSWEAELDIWKQAFFNKSAKLQCDPHSTNLVLTEAANCPQALQQNSDQIIFEELQFASAHRCIGSTLNVYNEMPSEGTSGARRPECLVVVDSGYSQTTVVPMLRGRPLHAGIRRLEIGGRFMTNRLKQLLSLRQFNLMDDPHLVNQIKEDACFVSQNFTGDLELSAQSLKKVNKRQQLDRVDNSIVIDYVLPDYHTTFRGYTRPYTPLPAQDQYANKLNGGQKPKEDSFPLANERFAVPELLFSPSDVGLPQAGLAETIVQSLEYLPPGLWPAALANVLVVGGNACLPGFTERLQSDLRCLAPSECRVEVRRPADPVGATWRGGAALAIDKSTLQERAVTREEYQEYGAAWTSRSFAQGTRG